MAISAAIQPIKTEYKPLGLEVFAKPLSEMQQKFDTTKAEIDAADFAVSRLSKDDPRSKELVEEVEAAQKDLANNLMNTKNYRQAAQRLMQINKKFNKNEEINAITGNYNAYNAVKKDVDALEKAGKITPETARLWEFKTLGEFKGTQFKDGKYQSIQANAPMENMEQEIRTEALKVAAMTPEQINEYVDQKNVDAFTKTTIQTLIKKKEFDQVAYEILKFLKTSDKYQQWYGQESDLQFYYKNATDENYKYTLPQETVDLLDYNISALQKSLANPNIGDENKASVTAEIQRLSAQRDNIADTYNSLSTPEEFEALSRQLHLNVTKDKLEDIAKAAADVVDFKHKTYTITDQTDSEAKAKAAGSLKLLEEIGDVTANSVTTNGNPATLIQSGDATGNVATTPYNQNTYEQMKRNTPQDIAQLKNIAINPANETQKNALDASKDMFIVLGRTEELKTTISEKLAEVQVFKKQLSSATGAEKNKLESDLETARQDVKELEVSLTNENKTLSNIIEATANDPTIKKLWEESGKDIVPFMQKINTATVDYLKGTPTASAEAAKAAYIKQATSIETEVWDYNANKKVKTLIPNPQLTPEKIQEIEAEANARFSSKDFLNNTNTEAKKLAEYSTKIMGAYRSNLAVNQYAIGQEISYTEGVDKFMNGKFGEAIKHVKENQRGASPVIRADFNVKTGESKPIDNNNFDLAAYEPTPHYAGIDSNGVPIFRYVRKTAYAEDAQTANSLIGNSIKTQKGGVSVSNTLVAKPAEIKAWREANPADLYLQLPGWGGNPSKAAEDNYVEISKTATQLNNQDAMQQNLANYAPIHLISNAKRRENYYEMSARLEDAVKNDHKYTEIIQPPAAWKNNGDGTFTGYAITYKVIDKQIHALVSKGELTKNDDIKWETVKDFPMESFSNLPAGLVQLDLMYGTGDERDLVNKSGLSGGPYVPAFNF